MINKLKYRKFKINLSWLLFDKIFRASANIFLSIFLARNLGPESFGILNYFLAFLFLFSSISAFGINPVLVNQIVKT
ncbi:oligosaccharide flippase family protein, partial [Candidatus Pelagibacter sp.]|nr:oligosaccharide flippase family protein [Candidatus Pelagibacter sp.]